MGKKHKKGGQNTDQPSSGRPTSVQQPSGSVGSTHLRDIPLPIGTGRESETPRSGNQLEEQTATARGQPSLGEHKDHQRSTPSEESHTSQDPRGIISGRGHEQGRGFGRRTDLDRSQFPKEDSTKTKVFPVKKEEKGPEKREDYHSRKRGDRLERGQQEKRSGFHHAERREQERGGGDYHTQKREQERGDRDYHTQRREQQETRGQQKKTGGYHHAQRQEHEWGGGDYQSQRKEKQGRDRDYYAQRREEKGGKDYNVQRRGEDYRTQRREQQGRSGGYSERHEEGRGKGHGQDYRKGQRREDFHDKVRERKRSESDESISTVSKTEKPDVSQKEVSQQSIQPFTASTQHPSDTSLPVSAIMQLRIASGLAIPHRKNLGAPVVGTRGEKIKVQVNHFALKFEKSDVIAIHYDVEFKPNLPKKLLKQVINALQRRDLPGKPFAFDGKKNIYSCGKLPFGDEYCSTVKIFDEERQQEKDCEVKIKYASQVNLSLLTRYTSGIESLKMPQEAKQALDIVLRNPASMIFTPVGNSFFSPPTEPIVDLGDGLELWRGFFQSVILGWKPYLNVDVAHKGFPKDINLIQFLVDTKRGRTDFLNNSLHRSDVENLEKYVKGLKIEYVIPNQPNTKRVFKVNRVVGAAISERFALNDGHTMTVGEYFEKEKNYRLRYPHMPCLHVGNENKTVYMPLELCSVVKGQVVNRKLNSQQTTNMVRNAAKPADERKMRIREAIRLVNFNRDSCVRDFGVSVSDEFATVPARILNPPDLQYGNRVLIPERGAWRLNSTKLLNTRPLQSWLVVHFTDDNTGRRGDFRRGPFVSSEQLGGFVELMMKIGNRMGMQVRQPHDYVFLQLRFNRTTEQLTEIFDKYVRQYEDLQLIIIVIDEKFYAPVKQAAELKVGVLTQCIMTKTMTKMNDSTCSNILLKINAKLNGINNSVTCHSRPRLFENPVMIVGADVTHPAPGEDGKPSIAAVTSSYDPTCFKCNMDWRIQSSRQEIIVDLKNIIKKHLMYFYDHNNGLKPEKIIYYRDGVGEGMFSQILNVEMQAIRQACSEFPNYNPPITILIVQKRHHTRFFPITRQYTEGRGNNVLVGTIVDTDITHPKEMDFYLVSHASLQGTARPTKYHKIWDDSDFNDDDLEQLTYYLCHLFARCTRSVSYPAPTYYAHLAAFRARTYLEGSNCINLNNLEHEQQMRTIHQQIVNDSPMFFV